MNISIRQLEAVAAVAEHGSFTRAAAVLGTTQPALSQQIRDLEAELGVKLFDRTTRRVEPTRAGSEFIVTATRILGDLKLAMANAADLASKARGRIAVAAPPLLATALLPGVIAAFRAAHPGVEVAMFDVASDRIVAKVINGEADIGVGTFAPDVPGVVSSTIGRDRMMLFEAGEVGGAGAPARWTDLSGVPHIMLTRESAIRFLVDHGLAMAGLTIHPAFEVTQIATALGLVEAGLGVAVLPAHAMLAGAGRRVRARPLVDPVLTRDIAVLRAADRSWPPGADAFLRMLARQMTLLSQPHEAENRT